MTGCLVQQTKGTSLCKINSTFCIFQITWKYVGSKNKNVKIVKSVKHLLFTNHSDFLIFRFQVGLSCIRLYRSCIIIGIPLNARHHIHRGLIAHIYTDIILRRHGKPHNDCHALTDKAIFLQVGATPHAARKSQRCLTNWCPFVDSIESRY